MADFAQWVAGKTPRERLLLGIAVLMGALVLLGVFVVDPLVSWRHDTEARLEKHRALLAWVEPKAAEAARLTRRTSPESGRLSMAQIEQSLRDAGLTEALRRLSPGVGSQFEAAFEAVSYEDMLEWLARTQASSGMTVQQMRIEPAGAPGLVNLSLTATR